ncbi:hypothetical protein B0H13DRAFT_2322585 [Mycena leptocephala]|nr:hypothetical protein B0H13DRAFT_2322585 [Mycena leptocephala]
MSAGRGRGDGFFLPPPLLLSPLLLTLLLSLYFQHVRLPRTDPELVDKLIRLGLDAQTTSLMAIAFFALLVYDHLSTLDDEVEFVWLNPKPSLARYLYIWNRYFSLMVVGICAMFAQNVDDDETSFLANPLCELLSNHHPSRFHPDAAVRNVPLNSGSQLIDDSVWILFGKERKLLFLIVPWIVAQAGIMILIGELTVQERYANVHVPFIRACYSLGGLPWFFFFIAVPSLVLGFIMFCLTIYNCHTRLQIKFSQILYVKESWMPVATLFLRDGVFWFLAVIAVNPVQILLWQLAPVTLSEVLMVPSMVVYSIIAAAGHPSDCSGSGDPFAAPLAVSTGPISLVAETRGRSRKPTVLPTVQEIFTPSPDGSQPEVPLTHSDEEPLQLYLTVPPNDPSPERTDRRTPLARDTPFENEGLPGLSRHLSTQLPSNSSGIAQMVSRMKPLNWTGRVEGESYTVRARK